MNRQQKEHIITSLKNEFDENKLLFVVGYKGLSVAKLVSLRRSLQKEGARLKIAKVTFIRRAIEQAPQEASIGPFLSEQIALVFSKEGSSAVAKVLYNFSKENEKFNLVAGCFERKPLDQAAIKKFALLPSREALLGQLCWSLKAPIVKMAYVLKLVSERSAPLVNSDTVG